MSNLRDKSEARFLESPHVVAGFAVALPWLWLCWRYWDYYPLWDAGIYYECALGAAATTKNPLAFNFAGHPTMGYFWLPGMWLRYFGGSYRLFLVYNSLLGWLMSHAVADIAVRLLRGERRRLDLVLLTGSVMYCPVVLTSIVQLSPDYGVLVFLTLAARAFMRERLLPACVWGVLAALSKESGALLFVVEAVVYYVVYVLRAPRLIPDKMLAVQRRLPFVLIAMAGVLGAGMFLASKGTNAHWWQGGLLGVIRQFSSISFLDNILLASLSTILVLNCMWIPTAIVLGYLAHWLVMRLVLALPRPRDRDPAVEFVAALCLLDLVLLTRFRTFTNVRYYVPVFPWLILLAARAMLDMRFVRPLRVACQGAILVALGWSNFRSFDPVSANVFGTMRFGEHRLFKITSLTGECCGLGRDQIVYNLEFAEIDYLLRGVLPFVLSSKDHAIAAHPEADWKLWDSINPRTLRRADPTVGSFKVPNTHTWAVNAAPAKPAKIYYITMPNMPDSNELIRYGAWYNFDWRKRRFEHNGYYIDVHELTLKH